MKKISAFLLSISMLLLIGTVGVFADEFEQVEEEATTEESQDSASLEVTDPEDNYVLPEMTQEDSVHVETKEYDAVIYNNTIPRERFMDAYNAKRGRPHLFLSEAEGDEANLATVHFNGEDALFFKGKAQYAYGKVPDVITADTKNAAVKVTFYDRYIDYFRYTYTLTSGSGKNVLICKNGSNEWRTETILLDNSTFTGVMKHGSDFYLNTYDSSLEMGNDYIADVEFINLDTEADAVTQDGKKQHVIQQGTLLLMAQMGFFDESLPLEDEANGEAAAAVFKKITGKDCALFGEVTLKETIDAFSEALGVKHENENDYIASGIIRNLTRHEQKWFGTVSYKTQSHGLYDIAVNDYSKKLYNDELVGLCYNLLYIYENGESYLAKLCEDEAFFDNMAYTNDRNLVYTYYYEKGIRVKEHTRIDEITGETINEFYCPGTNMNIPYINELTTVDNENYIFCAAVDKQYDGGFPVVYNRKTGKTTTVDTRRIAKFAQVLAPTNVMYYTVQNEIWSYNINTGEKKKEWAEPFGSVLQEIPTVTNDGRYVCVFWGKINKSHPDHIGILDTQTGEMKTYLSENWVAQNLYGAVPIFVGHVIINPADETIVQFLHGGPSSVEDRMWLLDTKTNKTWIAPEMTRRFDGGFGEKCVHWVWTYDGKKIYYCRMSETLTAEPGVVYYDYENPENGVVQVNDAYPYTHAVPSYDGKLFIADTNKTPSDGFYRAEIVLYDSESDFAKLLAFNTIWSAHPCHSHPTFSLDASEIFYNSACLRDATVRVGSIEVKNALEKMRAEGNTKHYTTAKVTLGEKNIQEGIRVRNDVENGTPPLAKVNGEICRAIMPGVPLYVDVDGEHILPDDDRVCIKLTYFDNSEEPFQLAYNTGFSAEDSRTKNAYAVYVPRRNTNQWVTREIILNNTSFRSATAASYDFSINAQNDGNNVFVKAIEATALK